MKHTFEDYSLMKAAPLNSIAMMSDGGHKLDRHGPACDSGASWHYSPNTAQYRAKIIPDSIIRDHNEVEVASGHILTSTESALFALRSTDPRCKGVLFLRRTHLTDGLRRFLCSVASLSSDGYDTLFTEHSLTKRGEAIVTLRSEASNAPVFIFPQESKQQGNLYGVGVTDIATDLSKKQLRMAAALVEKDRQQAYSALHCTLAHIAPTQLDSVFHALHGKLPRSKPVCRHCKDTGDYPDPGLQPDPPPFISQMLLAKVHASGNPFKVFHDSMGHRSYRITKNLFEKATGLKAPPESELSPCISCGVSKLHNHINHEEARHMTTQPIEQIAVDLQGPFRVRSPFGHRYIFHAHVKHIKYSYRCGVKRKSEFAQLTIDFIMHAQRLHAPLKVVRVAMDNELAHNSAFEAFLGSPDGIGIQPLWTAPENSTQNGGAERGHRTGLESGQAALHRSGLPAKMLIPAICYQSYILSTIPQSKNPLAYSVMDPSRPLSPMELFERYDAGTYKQLFQFNLPFGSLAAALKLNRERHKGAYPGEECLIIGRAPRSKCWLLYSLAQEKYIRRVSIQAYPNTFPAREDSTLDASSIRDASAPLVLDPSTGSGGHKEMEEPSEDDADSDDGKPITTEEPTLKSPHSNKWPITAPTQDDTSRRLDFNLGNEEHMKLPTITEHSDEDQDEVEVEDSEPLLTATHAPTPPRSLRQRRERHETPWKYRAHSSHKDLTPTPPSEPPPTPFRPGEERLTDPSVFPANEQRVIIVDSKNDSEEVEVTFPDYKDPDQIWKIDKSSVEPRKHANYTSTPEESLNPNMNPFFGPSLFHEHSGTLFPSCYFTIDRNSSTDTATCQAFLAAEHHKEKPIPRIGVTFADEVELPRFHIPNSGHPLSGLIEEAERKEIAKLLSADTYSAPFPREDAPAGTQIIDTMFVYKAVADEHGRLAGIRARLTLRGDQQAANRYRKEATAPVYLHVTLRITLCKHANNPNVRLIQADVAGAYLTALMRSRVIARLPARYRGLTLDNNGELAMPQPTASAARGYHNTVVDVIKALYGGDDSGRCFYDEWVSFHLKLDFKPIVYDKCYLYLHTSEGFIEMLWHVDDTLYFSSGTTLWDWYKAQIATKYELDFREVQDGQTFTGFRICRYPHLGYTTIDQQVSVDKTLRALGHERTAERKNPVLQNHRPTKFDAPSTPEEIAHASRVPYNQCTGCLQWLQSVSHAELTYPIKVASMRTHDHGKAAWMWCKQILGFLRKNPYQFLVLRFPSSPTVNTDSDSDYSKCPETRKSLSGYCIFIGDSLIAWGCEVQRCIAMSTTEAELVGAELAQRRTRAIINLVEALGFPTQHSVQLRIDNDRAFDLATQPIQPGANGHMHARYFSILEWHQSGLIQITPVDSARNRADLMVTWKDGANFHFLAAAVKGYYPLR